MKAVPPQGLCQYGYLPRMTGGLIRYQYLETGPVFYYTHYITTTHDPASITICVTRIVTRLQGCDGGVLLHTTLSTLSILKPPSLH